MALGRKRKRSFVAGAVGIASTLGNYYNQYQRAKKAVDSFKIQRNKYRKVQKAKSTAKAKPKPKGKVIMAPTRGMSQSSKTIKYKSVNLKIYKAITNLAGFSTNGQSTATAGTGVQAPTVMGTWNSGSFLKDVFKNAQNNLHDVPITLPSRMASQKLFIQTFTRTQLFNNAAPVDCEMTIYDLVAKTTQPLARDPLSDWNLGYDHQTNTVALTLSGIPFAKPTESKLFNMNWRIINTQRVYLSPGCTHKHIFRHVLNRPIDLEYANTMAHINGITNSSLIVIKGTPVDNTNTSGAGVVTLAPCKVISTWTAVWSSRLMEQNARVNVAVNNFSTTEANLYQQDEESGAVEQIKVAGVDTGYA